MPKGLIGKKIGMTQVFSKNGEVIPVTIIEVTPNIITQIKSVENDGYVAIQLAVGEKKVNRSNKAEMGHFKKAKVKSMRIVRELKITESESLNYALGQQLEINLFSEGEVIDIQATSKGKGFQGNIKRHGQKMGPNSHGSRYHRRPGSMGAVAPQVFKGKNLPGHMGSATTTVQNLKIVMIDVKNNLLIVKGNVPGSKNSFCLIKSNIKNHQPVANFDLKIIESPKEEATLGTIQTGATKKETNDGHISGEVTNEKKPEDIKVIKSETTNENKESIEIDTKISTPKEEE